MCHWNGTVIYVDLYFVILQMATVMGADGVTHYVYTISGVRVEFPAKAYPSQIAMMDKVSIGVGL